MELLYNNDINPHGNNFDLLLQDHLELIDGNEEEIDKEYIKLALSKESENHDYIISLIESNLEKWTLNRVAKVNIAILRVAITEMLYIDDVPEKVSINEAINLTKKYSDESNKGFINTVLDKVYKEISKKEN